MLNLARCKPNGINKTKEEGMMTKTIQWTAIMAMLAFAVTISAPVPADAGDRRPALAKKHLKHKPGKAYKMKMKHKPGNVRKAGQADPQKSGGNPAKISVGAEPYRGRTLEAAAPLKSGGNPAASTGGAKGVATPSDAPEEMIKPGGMKNGKKGTAEKAVPHKPKAPAVNVEEVEL